MAASGYSRAVSQGHHCILSVHHRAGRGLRDVGNILPRVWYQTDLSLVELVAMFPLSVSPSELVAVLRLSLVAVFSNLTVAALTTAPLGSVTVPVTSGDRGLSTQVQAADGCE